jgi:putative glutamine amidotransferase
VTRRPLVGITVSLDAGARIQPGRPYLYVARDYAGAVHAAGGVPLLVPPDADPLDAARACDAFVVTGGGMLPASLEEAVPADPTGGAELAERIAWDRRLLDAALAARRPLLGVCYGMQLLNLHAGGTLLPDLAGAVPPAAARPPVDHGGAGRSVAHAIATRAGSRLRDLLGPDARVASSHRQAVDRVAAGFRVAATAADGVVEAIEPLDTVPVLAVEWHPEADATAAAIYGWLVQRIEERA